MRPTILLIAITALAGCISPVDEGDATLERTPPPGEVVVFEQSSCDNICVGIATIPALPAEVESFRVGESVIISESWRQKDYDCCPGSREIWTVLYNGNDYEIHPAHLEVEALAPDRSVLASGTTFCGDFDPDCGNVVRSHGLTALHANLGGLDKSERSYIDSYNWLLDTTGFTRVPILNDDIPFKLDWRDSETIALRLTNTEYSARTLGFRFLALQKDWDVSCVGHGSATVGAKETEKIPVDIAWPLDGGCKGASIGVVEFFSS